MNIKKSENSTEQINSITENLEFTAEWIKSNDVDFISVNQPHTTIKNVNFLKKKPWLVAGDWR